MNPFSKFIPVFIPLTHIVSVLSREELCHVYRHNHIPTSRDNACRLVLCVVLRLSSAVALFKCSLGESWWEKLKMFLMSEVRLLLRG
jgi:hypothetical protein